MARASKKRHSTAREHRAQAKRPAGTHPPRGPVDPPDATARRSTPLHKVAVFAALVAAASGALLAHGMFLTHAGALWRDEVNTATFAAMPSFQAIGEKLRYDSVPLASTLLVRTWSHLGLGSDFSLRVLGFLIGIAALVALGWNAWRNRVLLPVCTILLFSLNIWVIRGGDAIRPTGLGVLFIVLAFTTLAAALEQPRPWRIVIAALCAVLAVQSIYSNVPLVAAICIAGMAVGLVSRSWTRVAISAGVGIVAALTLLPYLPQIQAGRDWGVLIRSRPDLARFVLALESTAAWHFWAWVLLAVGALTWAIVRVTRGRASRLDGDRDRVLYAAVALVLGGVGFIALVTWSQLVTQPWYYIPLMGLAAACLDLLSGSWVRRPAVMLSVAIVLVVATLSYVFAIAPMLRVRQTNVDLIAAKLQSDAVVGDLVIVNPWFIGVTFHRYYKGPTRWTTIPPLEDNSIHRYDLLKRRMEDPATMDSTLSDIARTLQAGKRVWLVGGLPPAIEGTVPQPPPRAPTQELGWNIGVYADRWGQLAYALLRQHVGKVDPVSVPAPGAVSPYENAPLFVVEGWR